MSGVWKTLDLMELALDQAALDPDFFEMRAKLGKMRKRLNSASQADRMYERPVSWEDAEWLAALAAVYVEICIAKEGHQ